MIETVLIEKTKNEKMNINSYQRWDTQLFWDLAQQPQIIQLQIYLTNNLLMLIATTTIHVASSIAPMEMAVLASIVSVQRLSVETVVEESTEEEVVV